MSQHNMARYELQSQLSPDETPFPEHIVPLISDLFAATLIYATQVAGRELSRCSIQERVLVERKYGYTDHTSLVMAFVQEAADTLGIKLGMSIGKVATEELPVVPSLVTFEDLMDELVKAGE